MLRTEPATLSLPGPCGAAGFHPCRKINTTLAATFRSRCSHQPGRFTAGLLRGNAVSRAALRRCGGLLLIVIPGAISPFKSLSPGLRQAQPALQSRDGNAFRDKFFPAIPRCSIRPQKIDRSPRTAAPGRARLRPCGEGSQTGEGHTTGNKTAGSRKTSKPRLS